MFATTYSPSVQDSLYRMGEAALAAASRDLRDHAADAQRPLSADRPFLVRSGRSRQGVPSHGRAERPDRSDAREGDDGCPHDARPGHGAGQTRRRDPRGALRRERRPAVRSPPSAPIRTGAATRRCSKATPSARANGSWCSMSASTSPRPTCRPPIHRSWTASRSASGSPPPPTTTCRCWWRRGATPLTEAVEPALRRGFPHPLAASRHAQARSAEQDTRSGPDDFPARESACFLSMRA